MGIEPVGLIVTNQDQEKGTPRCTGTPRRAAMASAGAALRTPRGRIRTGPSLRGVATVAALLAVVIVAAAAGAFAPRFAPDLVPSALTPYLVVGMAGLVALTFLCLAAPVGCLVAAFALLSVVRSEPAPVDLLFVLLILTELPHRSGGRRRPTPTHHRGRP